MKAYMHRLRLSTACHGRSEARPCVRTGRAVGARPGPRGSHLIGGPTPPLERLRWATGQVLRRTLGVTTRVVDFVPSTCPEKWKLVENDGF